MLFPLDKYTAFPVGMMDRVPSDKAKLLEVPAYGEVLEMISGYGLADIEYIERFEFYQRAKNAFAVIQTDDSSLYANIIIQKGVI